MERELLTWPQVLPVLWILVSLLLYWAAVLFHRAERFSRLTRLLAPSTGWAWLLAWLLKTIYFLGLPYMALIQGAISPHWMGLIHFDLYVALGMGSILTAGAFVFLALDWRFYLRHLISHGTTLRPLPLLGVRRMSLVDVILLEAHWAFYRGAMASFVGDYLGAFLGLALVGVEWAADLSLGRRAAKPEERETFLHEATLAFVVAVVFALTRSFWACLGAHMLLHFGVILCIQYWGKHYGWDRTQKGRLGITGEPEEPRLSGPRT